MLLLELIQSEVPRGSLPSMTQLVTAGAPRWAAILALIGDLLWGVVYILAIRIGFRQRTYAIPMAAIGLNVTWEVVHTAIHPPPEFANLIANLLWLGFDLVIVLQLIGYGRHHQRVPIVRRFFPLLVGALLGMTLIGHATFYTHVTANAIFPDTEGVVSAYLINLVMSVLFIHLYFNRPDGSSKAIAWLKFLGTGAISLANVVAFLTVSTVTYETQYRAVGTTAWAAGPVVGSHSVHPGFLNFLAVAIAIFDLTYLVLLYRRPATVDG